MSVQIYSKEFIASKNSSFYANEREEDARAKALEKANEFFFAHDSVDIINIIENWNDNRDLIRLVVYYKDYI